MQHDVAQALDLGRFARGALGRVAAGNVVPGVDGLRRLARQRGQLVGAVHHPDQDPARVGQIDRDPAEAVRKLRNLRAGRVGEPQDVGGFGGPERGAQVRRPRSPAHDHTGCAAIGPAQLQLVRRPTHRAETERMRKSLRAGQVRLLELQPGQILGLDRRVGCPTRVLPAEPSLFAVQVVVSPVMGGHRLFLSALLTKSSLMTVSSVKS